MAKPPKNQSREDDVLRRMLSTPPTPHAPLGKKPKKVKPSSEQPLAELDTKKPQS